MRSWRLVCTFVWITTCPLVGCGDRDELTVITPTENYQLSQQEQQNQERFESMREQREP